MSRQYVTVREAAQRLGLSYHRTRFLLIQRKLKGARAGTHLLVDAADLERLIRARRPRVL